MLITILVLELKPPSADTFSALLPLWPTGLSYAVSYLFIAIVWVNHHHLFSYAEVATPRLMWSNFAVNITYVALCWEAVDLPAHEDVTSRIRRLLHMRSFITIGVFAAAAVIALWWPVAAMVLICLCLIGYLRPDVPAKDDAGQTG